MTKFQNNRFLYPISRATLFALFLLMALFLLNGGTSAATATNQSADGVWADVAENDILVQGERMIVPESYRTVTADLAALAANLAQAPMEFTAAAENNQTTIILPLPDGRYQEFYIYESPVMHPDLAAKFPEIKTYTVKGVEDVHATGRLDLTPHGFHAMVYSPGATFYIDPYSQRDTANYISYYKADFSRDEADLMEELPPLGEALPPDAFGGVTTGPTLRTHRLAVATTGEYAIYHGGTVPLAMAAIVTAINRVTGIYEREIAVRMELIPNNDDVVFLNPATDPYTNNNGSAMLAQNQTTLDNIIGTANYDIGHVFSTGGGGIAALNAVCNSATKARGVTGLTNPIGDPFYVDYVAHEMGHQYGGHHTFNGNAGACAGNGTASAAYEPGSGSTIQAYAGICGDQNLQSNSDDYFHTYSFQQMAGFSHSGGGSTCGTTSATGNNAPSADAGNGGFTIPANTPFSLTGSATDPDGDPLTYNWEEFDLGPAGHPNSPVGNAPIFRSFDPLTSPTRYFPRLSDVVNNTQTIGEIMPTYTRSLSFRLTARDNHVSPSGGGVDYDIIAFSVTADAGPFEVISPNDLGGTTWPVGATREVTWDVANTDTAPVNCTAVDIDLSTDGGYTIAVNLASNTPNDGSALVVVPNMPTATARIWVSCANNIFYDMSDADFTIANQGSFAELLLAKRVSPEGNVTPGTTLEYTISMTNTGNLAASATITDTFADLLTDTECDGVPGDLSDSLTLNPSPANAVNYECTADVDASLAVEISKTVDQTDISAGDAVTYTITVTNPNAVSIENVTVSDPDVASCTPNIGTPIVLGPGASQTYVCPNNILTQSTTNTAVVSAEIAIDNTATASAPEATTSPVDSNTVTTIVDLTAQDSVSVNVESTGVYLPAVFKTAASAAPTATLPAIGLSAVLLGGAMMVVIGRRK